MQYELYTKVTDNDKYAYLYNLSSDNIKIIHNFIKFRPPTQYAQYIIIDNNATSPINHCYLGLEKPHSFDEHYQIVYECKLAKEYFNCIVYNVHCKNDFDIPFDKIYKTAKYETELYFEKYNTK